MSQITISGIQIAAMATSVPPVTEQINYLELGLVNIRKSNFEQTTADLGYDAAFRIIEAQKIDLNEIGVLIFISRTPDYRSPNTAAVLQGRLGLSIDCICYDINAGANGFSTGVQVASSILKNINKSKAFIIFGDTPSKLNNEQNSIHQLESDAATCILLEKTNANSSIISYTESFGAHFEKYAILKGGFRYYGKNIKFDSTEKSNFKINFDEPYIESFVSEKLPIFLNTVNQINNNYQQSLLVNNQLPFIGLNKVDINYNDTILKNSINKYGLTYSSLIPIQLQLLKEISESNKEKNTNITLNTVTFGEGLVLNYTSFEIDLLNILTTNESIEFFSEYKVSHDI